MDFARWLAFKRDDPIAHRQLMADAGEELRFAERPVVGWSNAWSAAIG